MPEAIVNTATTTVVASTTSVASATKQIPEVSPWVSYGVDIVLVIVFLYILLFTKAEKTNGEELTPEEMPNELEQVIRTDPEDSETEATEAETVEKKEKD